MKPIYTPDPRALGKEGFDFCPGCGYGSILLSLTEVVRKMVQPPVFMVDIGCVDFMTAHMPGDVIMGTHGRTTALASGYKRVTPDRLVCTIQGDGGFMGIGATESLYTAVRGEPITAIVLQNGVLADTGGQMAPTTLSGQVTTTTPKGRATDSGKPLLFLEMLSGLDGVAYAERVAIASGPEIRKVGRALERAFEVQSAGIGMSIVEILTPCPTHWRMDPVDAWKHIQESTETVYRTGVLKNKLAGSAE